MDETPDQIKNEKIHSILEGYRDFLKVSEYSNATIKNYLSDLRHLIEWTSERYQKFSFVHLDLSSLRAYRSFVKERFRAKPSIAARRLSSLRKFLGWAGGKKYVPEYLVKASEEILLDNPTPKPSSPTQLGVQILTSGVSSLETGAANFFTPQKNSRPPMPDDRIKKLLYHIKYLRPAWYQRYHETNFHRPLHYAMLGLFLLLAANFMFGHYIDEAMKSQVKPDSGSLLAATAPPKILSFQGRLTDENSVPITSTTDVDFKIYDAETGGTLLWTSKDWDVAPDANGIFSVCLGNTGTTDECLKEPGDSPDSYTADTAFSATLFSDNAALYLDLTVEGESLSPRQRIAASSFALNSDTLDGIDSTSLLRSDTSDSFDSGTLTIVDGTTLTVNSTTIGIGNASSDTLTVNAAGTFNTDVNLAFAGSENLDLTNATWSTAATGLFDINTTSSTSDTRGLDNYFDVNSTGAMTQYGYYGNFDATSINLDTDVQPNYYGIYQTISKTGTDTANSNQACDGATVDCYTNVYGVYSLADNTSATDDVDNVRNTYGGYFSATGNTNSTSTAYGIYASASGADTNYAGYFSGPTLAALTYTSSSSINANQFILLNNGSGSADSIFLVTNFFGASGTTENLLFLQNLDDSTTTDGIKISSNPGTITNGIEFVKNSGGFTQELLLQNGETIDNVTDGTVAIGGQLTITIDAGATAVDAICGDSTLNGDMAADATDELISDCSGNPTSDYAEIYPTENDVEYGDILVAGTNLANVKKVESTKIIEGEFTPVSKLAKSNSSYDAKIIGIASNNYGDFSSTGHGVVDEADHPLPVALNGRVPTKVSTENGSIAVGDPLTSSSIPGVAMKATRSGPIVGKALEPYNNSNPSAVNQIMVFVNLGWYYAENSSMVNELKVGLTAASKFEWTDSFGNTIAWVNDLGEAFFTKVTSLVGDFQKLVFGELVAKKEARIAGQASFAANDTEVVITSDKVRDDSLINLTAVSKTGGVHLYIKEIRSGESFTVGLEHSAGDQPNQATASATQAIKFTWFIINQQ